MSGIEPPGTVLPPALAPPPSPRAVEPRTVEPAEGGALADARPELTFSTSRAVLLLLRRSAETFREVVELTGDVPAAVAISGAAVDAGSHVDHYA